MRHGTRAPWVLVILWVQARADAIAITTVDDLVHHADDAELLLGDASSHSKAHGGLSPLRAIILDAL